MVYIRNNELYHHGIKGQKWGVRRYQNPDGTLTIAGRKRYGDSNGESIRTKHNTSKAVKTALGVGAAAAGTALLAYGAYKLDQRAVSSISESYKSVARLYAKSAISSFDDATKYLNNADKERLLGNEADKERWFENYKYAKKLAYLDFDEADRLNKKADSKLSLKERAKASADLLKRGQVDYMQNKRDEIFRESNKRMKAERDKIFDDWEHRRK